ncbi:nitrilase-related carbon-nitrogen hydrolase [Saccharothrix carnea]|uniref:nitrilase-related carbon-nitrogen hydrolase n=1 Tax=Saccharothrix carnea TaxID=1280637 RepID=UPI0015E7A5D2
MLIGRARGARTAAVPIVAMANSVGGQDDWIFDGGAALHDPDGQTVTQAPDEGEAVAVAEFNPRRWPTSPTTRCRVRAAT